MVILVGLFSGVIGALFGGLITWKVNKDSIDAQLRIAREQINQQRFSEAYVTLQRYISGWADHAAYRIRHVRFKGEVAPKLPDISDSEIATSSLFASDEVMTLFDKYGGAVWEYRVAIGNEEILEEFPQITMEERQNMIEARRSTRESATKIVEMAEAMHKHLRSEIQGHRMHRSSGDW